MIFVLPTYDLYMINEVFLSVCNSNLIMIFNEGFNVLTS